MTPNNDQLKRDRRNSKGFSKNVVSLWLLDKFVSTLSTEKNLKWPTQAEKWQSRGIILMYIVLKGNKQQSLPPPPKFLSAMNMKMHHQEHTLYYN